MADNADDLIISISADQATLRRSIQRIEQTLDGLSGSVQRKFEAVGRSIDNSVSSTLQQRINAMVGIGTSAAKEWTGALADQGRELERLRAKYNPLFAVITNYKNTVAEIKSAHAQGAISATEMANAIGKERQAALASTAAIKARNSALNASNSTAKGMAGGSTFQTANIAAQFQDIAVQLQGGGKPLTVALQQGTQLASIFQTLGEGKSVVGALGAAFASLVSPVSLVTIGLIAAGGAAYQYFSSLDKGSDRSAEVLQKEAELIQKVVDKWGSALPALKAYNDEREKLAGDADVRDAAAAAVTEQWDGLRKTIGDLSAKFPAVVRALRDVGAAGTDVAALQSDFGALKKGIDDGSATTQQLQKVLDDLARFSESTGVPKIDAFAKSFDGMAESIDKASTKAKAISGDAAIFLNLSKNLPPLGTLEPPIIENGRIITKPGEKQDYLAEQAANADPKILSNGLYITPPTPEKRPNVELEGLPGEVEKQEAAANKAATAAEELRKRQENLITTAQQHVEQLQLEQSLLGKYGVAADNARYALETLQKAEKLNLDDGQKKALQAKIDQYEQLSETLAKASLSQDLLDRARYNSLTPQEQQVSSTLRQHGIDDSDLNSPEARQVRASLQLEDDRQTFSSFLGDFKDGLLKNSESIGEAFRDALRNGLLKQADEIFDGLFNQLTNALFPTQPSASNGAAGTAGVGLLAKIFGGGSSPAVDRTTTGSIGGPMVSTGSAVDKAFSLVGLNENTNGSQINSFLKQGGVDIDAAQTKWCAAFVNSSLAQIGFKGTGSLTANSFLDWGTKIDPSQVLRGDVLVQSRGLGSTDAGGHVGFATGATQIIGGQTQLQMLSGNSGNSVQTTWVNAMDVQARRATDAANSLTNLASTSGQATQGLGTLGTGLNQFGQQLSNGFPAAPGGGAAASSGGGLFGWLGGLFGGSSQWDLAAAGKLKPGLFADGGHVLGPGSSRSDSIPAWLSNGEFVVNANATRKHRAMLEAINNGTIARFADGGIVTPPRLVSVPTAPVLNRRSGSNYDGPSIHYAPQIDARGADSAAVSRLQAALDQDRRDFTAKVITTVRDAKKTRQKGI